MYSNTGGQNNFVNAAQFVDGAVNAFEAAIASLASSGFDDDDYVHADAYNRLVLRHNWMLSDRNRLRRMTSHYLDKCSQFAVENERLRAQLKAARAPLPTQR